jgi:hypothetical protein
MALGPVMIVFKTAKQICCDGIIVRLVLLSVLCSLFTAVLSYAEDFRLLNMSLRARISGATMLGEQQPENFQEYDLTGNFGLPWQGYSTSGWGVGTRLMASAGVIYGGGETGLVGSLIPGIAVGSEDARVFLDMGAGLALLSRSQFGTQDFGGSFQFALTVGAGFPVYKQLGLGYRFLHYSDASVHGGDTIGADFHMIEFSYWP